jgi:hypothetical protein
VFFLAQSTTRWAQGCRPRSKRQVGFEKEDQDLVSASATAKNASCCRVLRSNGLAETVGEIDEVAPASVRLPTSHFDTRTGG